MVIRHLAMIMDGNRRWAEKNRLDAVYYRKECLDAVRVAAAVSINKKIPYLSLYMLSLENAYNRDQAFLDQIFQATIDTCHKQADELIKQGIRIRFIGERSLFPSTVLPAILMVEEKTKECTTLQVNLLFFYGGRQEIIHVIKQIARKVKDGTLTCEQINDQVIREHLWLSCLPDPDLIIRTGAQETARLSNFLLYQAAYSEIQFVDFYWPELTEERLLSCLREYEKVRKNFGR